MPPRLAEWLIERVLPEGIVRESIIGDLRESFAEAVRTRGPRRARTEYWIDVVRIAARRPGHSQRGPPPPSGLARAGRGIQALGPDVRFAFRGLRRSPGFTLVALLTLALGIGATTGIYSVIDGVFLRSPQVRAPGELVNVYTTCRLGDPRCSSSYPDYHGERSGLRAHRVE